MPTFTAINDEAPYSGFPITSRRACVHEARQRGAKRSAHWQNSKVVQKFRLRRCRACMWLLSDFQSAQAFCFFTLPPRLRNLDCSWHFVLGFYHSSCTVADDHLGDKVFLPGIAAIPCGAGHPGQASQHTIIAKLHLALKPLSYSLRRLPIAFRYSRRLRNDRPLKIHALCPEHTRHTQTLP